MMIMRKKKDPSEDEIFEENAKESNRIPLTQHATQVEEKQITTIQEIIPHPECSSPSKYDFDLFSRNPTTKDHEPTPKPPKKEKKVGSKKRKRRRDKEGKASVSGPSPSEKPPDDNEKEEPCQGERHFEDEVFEEHEGKSRKIPPTQHVAQVEGKQNTDRQELIIPPIQSHSPSRFDFDDITEIPSTKNENPTSKSPRKEQKAGLERSKRRRVGTAGDKEERASVAAPSSSGLIGTRVFTEEDETAMLKGMIDYGLSHNVSASSIGMNVLHEFLEGKLHSDFSKTQIYEKIRRLKQKFVKNMETYESSGEGPVLLKAHEAMAFELSKKIWGGNAVDNPNSNNHAKDRILEDNGTDMKSKRKSSRGKKNVPREFPMKVGAAAAAAEGVKDGEGHDDDGEVKVKKDHDDGGVKVKKDHDDDEVKDEEDHKDFKKNRLLEEIENVMKKFKLRLELAKLELNVMKKG